jgi:AcrR family transcriptional regulator
MAKKTDGTSSEDPVLRRRPRQVRAQERFERILDTAEQVFSEVGYDAATTNLIALRAQTSIGSLYEFFPNKEALARSLADRYIERIGGIYSKHLVDEPETEGPVIVAHIVEALDNFYRSNPGAVPLLNGRLTSQDLMEAGESLQRAFVAGIESIIVLRRPDTPKPTAHLRALVIAEIARSLLVLADQVPLSQRGGVIRELELAVVGYVSAADPLPESPPPLRRIAKADTPKAGRVKAGVNKAGVNKAGVDKAGVGKAGATKVSATRKK